MPVYTITKTRQVVFENEYGRVVKGFEVDFILTDYKELHTIQTESLDATNVQKAIMGRYEARKALDDQGGTKQEVTSK